MGTKAFYNIGAISYLYLGLLRKEVWGETWLVLSKLCPTYIAHMIGGPTRGENWTTKVANVDINNEIIQLNQCNYFKDS